MNTKYLNENELQQVADICEFYFTKDVKKTFKRLESKFKIEFTTQKQLNANLLWQAYAEEIKPDTHKDIRYNKTFAEAYNQTNGMNIEARDILSTYIQYNHQEDYSFVYNFDVDRIIDRINVTIRLMGDSYYSDSLTELLNTNDYYAFFSSKFGISNCNTKALKATKDSLKAFDELLNGVENKAGFFTALAQYYQTNDLSQFHNNIHSA